MSLSLRLFPYELRLREPFRISKGVRTVQPTVIVALSDGTHTGYGEASAISYYGQSVARSQRLLDELRPLVEAYTFVAPAHFYDYLRPHVADTPFIGAALDVAAHDLHARRRGVPLRRLLVPATDRTGTVIPTSYTIGIDTPARMVAKLRAHPWPVYKLKLGTADDLDLVRHLRSATDRPFRVDANGAWTATQTLAYAEAFRDLNVELIEQPLPADDWVGMQQLAGRTPLPIIADESCQTEADLDRCLRHFDGVNLKLSKCGGLTPLLRMLTRTRAAGRLVMAGCMVESSVGIAPLAHLLPLLDFVDMDGPLLVDNDPATGIDFVEGQAVIGEQPGTGIVLEIIKY